MLYHYSYLFLIFFLYSIIGYFVEIAFCSYHARKLVLNRGFFIGPYLPIYGSSVLLMYLFLRKYQDDPITLFIMAMFICSVMEFCTSYILEKIFKIRWWDYSQHKLNLDGRICLSNSILFGLGGIIVFYLFNPFFLAIIDSFSEITLMVTALICIVIFLTDFGVSITVLVRLKGSSVHFDKKDMTEETIKLRNQQLRKNSFLLTRLLNAFPKIEGRNKQQVMELKKKVNEIRTKLKETRRQKKDAKK